MGQKGQLNPFQEQVIGDLAGFGQTQAEAATPLIQNLGDIFNQAIGGGTPDRAGDFQSTMDARRRQFEEEFAALPGFISEDFRNEERTKFEADMRRRQEEFNKQQATGLQGLPGTTDTSVGPADRTDGPPPGSGSTGFFDFAGAREQVQEELPQSGTFSFDPTVDTSPLITNLTNQIASSINESSAARGAFGGSANQQQITNALAPLAMDINRTAFGQQAGVFDRNRANALQDFTIGENLANTRIQQELLPLEFARAFLLGTNPTASLQSSLQGFNQSAAQNAAMNPLNQLAGAAGGLGINIAPFPISCIRLIAVWKLAYVTFASSSGIP